MRNWLSGSICLVIVAISGIAFAQQSFYSIHISSHRQQRQADAQVIKLENQGLDAFVRHVEVPGKGMWYRIFIGKYATKKEATAEMKRLQQTKVSKYFAVRRLTGEAAVAAPAAAAAAASQAPAKAKVRPAAKSAGYYLFVGFYRDLDSARKEVDRLVSVLAPYGDRVLLTQETVSDGKIYRVYIGTYGDRQQAAAAGADLKNKKLLTSFYIPVQKPKDMIEGLMSDTAAAKAGAATAAAAAAAGAKTKPAEKQKPAGKVRYEKPAPAKRAPAADVTDFSRFTVMLKGGAFSPQDVKNFSVTQGATTYRISDDAAPLIGIEASVRFNKIFGLYLSGDTVLIDNTSWYNISAGPMLTFQTSDTVMPYLKGGAVYSDFSWDAPGEFDSTVGWEAGAGFNFLRTNFKIGIDLSYRGISVDYKPPSGVTVTPTDNSLDLSGFSVMATFSYWF